MTVGLLPHLALNKKAGIANVTLEMPAHRCGPLARFWGSWIKRPLHG
jgi:hypothetical protein